MKKSKEKGGSRAAESGYWLRMSHAPEPGEGSNVASMLPIMFFSAFVILIVHAFSYTRNTDDFYWMVADSGDQTDFFSYGKMAAILILAVVVIFIMLYRVMTATLTVKKSWVYVPMGVYALMTMISYAASEHKDFSLLGYIDRFEGTLVILAYLVMLFYIINVVNSERNVKMVIGAVGVSMAVLCVLGLTQALGHDFFRTEIGKRLMTPRSWWGELDSLNFTFEHNEIYQTVYNINYVSFYLALIIPIFALVMIYALNNFRQSKKTAAVGVLLVILMAGLVFNLGGSKSMGGVVGLAAAFIAALILFNKRLIQWWRSVAVLLVIVVAMFATTNSYWLPEIEELFSHDDNAAAVENTVSADDEGAVDVSDVQAADAAGSGDRQVAGRVGTAQSAAKDTAGTVFCDVDYFVTDGNIIRTSFNNDELDINVVMDETGNNLKTLVLTDGDGNELKTYGIAEADGSEYYAIDDERYHDYVSFYLTQDDDLNLYLILTTCDREWPFVISGGEVFYRNGQSNLVTLNKVPAYGFKNNQDFGSGRGYIWSRTIGMLKNDILIGDGADTFCINFPQNDYAGKYDAPSFRDQVDITVDKPHNMYMGMFQGTGGLSLLAFLAILIMYMMQAVKALKGNKYTSFADYAAAGILIGVIGFAVAGFMNDSSVSVMPLFYTMLGTGIAVDHIVMNKRNNYEGDL